MHHLQRVENVKTAIDQLYSDTSISQETTLDFLKEIHDNLEQRIEMLEGELKEEFEES